MTEKNRLRVLGQRHSNGPAISLVEMAGFAFYTARGGNRFEVAKTPTGLIYLTHRKKWDVFDPTCRNRAL